MILYLEGSSAIVSEPHVSRKEECVAGTIKIEVRREEACYRAGARRRSTLIVLFDTASK